MNNLNLMFNKTYYEKLGCRTDELESDIAEKNKSIFRTVFDPEKDFVPSALSRSDEKFRLMTTYPGLLIGTGNPHGTGDADADINTGFSFDYVTGQPYIPGSSVKGIMRSYFETPEKRRAIAEILRAIDGVERDDEQIVEIRDDIFNGRDIFFDAVVARGGYYGEIVGPDYLTPHKSPVSDPIPIHIIKIIPDVVFEFRFRFCDDGLLPRSTKTELFKAILMYFGAGAKTNTGYGRFTEVREIPEKYRGARPSNDDSSSHRNDRGNYRNDNRQRADNRSWNNGSKGKPGGGNKEMIRCPHCGANNYLFTKNGKKREWCYQCSKKLN